MGRARRTAVVALLVAGRSAAEPAIEELVVTARRVPEAAPEVPLVITVLDGDDLATGSVSGLQDLAGRAPGLSFESTWGGGTALPTMRGQFSPALGDTVAVFVDGVFQASRNALDVDLLDFDRAEVVFGPQGSLFGHTAFAGAVGYWTAEPSRDATAGAALDAGSSDYFSAEGWASGPLGAGWFGRVAVADRSYDGTMRNQAAPDTTLGGADRWVVAASVGRTGGGDYAWDAMLTGRYQRSSYQHPASSYVDGADYNCGGRDSPDSPWSYYCGELPVASRVAITPGLPDSTSAVGQLALQLALERGAYRLESLSGTYQADTDILRDFDGGAVGAIYGVCTVDVTCATAPGAPRTVDRLVNVEEVTRDLNDVTHLSQEFTVRYHDGRLDWLLGIAGYLTDDQQWSGFGATRGDLGADQRLTDYLPATPLLAGRGSIANVALVDDSRRQQVERQRVETRTTSLGTFGAAQYSVAPNVRLRGELRVQRDRIALDSQVVNFRPSFGRQIPAAEFDQWTARASIDADLADDLFAYASAARGSRPGGINPVPGLPAAEQTYDPEHNWTYELGFRHGSDGWLAGISGTVYYVDWSDTQINGLPSRPGSTTIIIVNTAGIETWGAAASATLRPSAWLSLDLAYNYARPRFTRGSDDPGSSTFCGLSAQNRASTFCKLGPPRNANDNSPALVPWLDGNAPGRAPATTWHAALVATPPVEWLGFRPWARVDANYQSSVYERQIDGANFGQRALLDARLGLTVERWSIEVWGTNLTDEDYIRASFSRLPVFYPTQPRPLDLIHGDGRRYGLTVRWTTD